MRRYLLFPFLLLLGLLAACQSTRPAFYFGYRPATSPTIEATLAPDSTGHGLAAAVTSGTTAPRPRRLVTAPTVQQHSGTTATTRSHATRRVSPHFVSRAVVAAARMRQQQSVFRASTAQQLRQRADFDWTAELGKGILILLGVLLGLVGLLLLVKTLFDIPFWAAFAIVVVGGLFLGNLVAALIQALDQRTTRRSAARSVRRSDPWNTFGLFVLLFGGGLVVVLAGLIAGSWAVVLVGLGICLFLFLLFQIIRGAI